MANRSQKARAARTASSGEDDQKSEPNLVRVEFDMMLKGHIFERDGGTVRQMGVTVDGSTRVITSGDIVDQKCYRALIDAGAIRA